ncbi:ArsR/SmtB family transcription factor [Phycicoccus sonneratiae]|uniref:Helix-turn-helix transcriptional regulator n=1 Tax=Phycicoccus sonneratiae TaxID=2807628 RepID=A0ABS2CKN3_9MICO|nr:helix-turn-helix domain-containing protein [Phycicoccus sonneraticus]MBM6400445.1 helix-turn-helix transcriptional regulator [Phycicoccus sonneraticus]
MANPYGDLELDARGMRALAHPVRVRLLGELQRHGPSTATRLSPLVGATPSVTSWHLRHLAEHGMVRDAPAQGSGRERWWEAVSRGYRLTTEGPGALEAGRALAGIIEEVEGDVVGDWHRDVEPTLPREWLEVAGRSSTRVLVTREELLALDAAWEQLVAPYVLRKDDPSSAPEGARLVHVLQHLLPGAPLDG